MTTTSRVRQLLWLTLAAAVVAAGLATPAGADPGEGPRSTFIVVLEDGVDPRAAGQDLARRHGGELGFTYGHALRGFSVRVSEQGAAGIARDRRVSYVERDQVVTTAEQSVPTGVTRSFAHVNDRLTINGVDDKRVDVDIAVIDTGIASHPDLNTVAWTNCSGGSPMRGSCADGSAPDGDGHGTHVAGTAAALDNGIGVVGMAPGARLHAVKVLSDNGSGYMSWIVAGIDWVTARADVIEVANMSLGCECTSSAMDSAIAKSVAAGVTYVVAAGNSSKDASTFSPANHPDVVTVSALADFDGKPGALGKPTCRSDEDDTLANFSNYGSLVEIAAPGVCITSTWPGGGYSTISGTSMASPHAAGAAAVLAASPPPTGHPTWSPTLIRSTLKATGNVGWTDEKDGVTEPLLDVRDALFAPRLVDGSTVTTAPAQDPTEPGPTDPEVAPISLHATGYKVKGVKTVDLSWTGATSTNVEVTRNGSPVALTANDGAHTDTISGKGGGSFTYRICEAGTSTCSNEVTVTF